MHLLLAQLPGMIWAAFLGLVMGNFATSPIYRLPRQEPLLQSDPFCDSCRAPLKPRDLFPVLSWLLTRGKCRYCHASVPGIYAGVEALCCLLFILSYLRFGFSESFLLVSFGMTAFVALAAMLLTDNFFSSRMFFVCVVLGMLYRTLTEGTLYGFAGSAFAAIIAAVILCKISGRTMTRDISQAPPYAKLLFAAGIWLPLMQLPAVLIAGAVALLFKDKKHLAEMSLIACVILLALYSHLTVSL